MLDLDFPRLDSRSAPLAWTRGLTLVGLALFGAGCGGGCTQSSLDCDDNGNCYVCDAYGCVPANGGPGSGAGSNTGGGAGGDGGAGSAGLGGGGSGAGGEATGGAGGEGSGGGGGACDPELTTCPCDGASAECPDDLACADGLCLAGCNGTYDCADDQVCANGQCVQACETNDDCGHPNQICASGVCVVDPQNPECDASNPCGAGLVCHGGLCADGCVDNADCDVGEVCDWAGGACIPDPSPTPLCDANVPCPGVNQVCWADGYCRYECDTLTECKLIDARFDHCDAGVCKTDEEVNPECDLSTPCPGGADCISNQCI